jgi:hypothetical protein
VEGEVYQIELKRHLREISDSAHAFSPQETKTGCLVDI